MKKQLLVAMALLCPAVGLAEELTTWAKITKAVQESSAYDFVGKGLKSAKSGINSAYTVADKKIGNGLDWVAGNCNRTLYKNLKNNIKQFPGQTWETIQEHPIATAAIATIIVAAGVIGYKLAQDKKKKK